MHRWIAMMLGLCAALLFACDCGLGGPISVGNCPAPAQLWRCTEKVVSSKGQNVCDRLVVVCVPMQNGNMDTYNAAALYLANGLFSQYPPQGGCKVPENSSIICTPGGWPGIVSGAPPLLNEPLCDATIAPLGMGGGSSTSCLALTDLCSVDAECCSGICSEQGVCETCRMNLEGCTDDAQCCSGLCSLNACGGNGLAPHLDGGV
jgi:hypothetical protein